MTSPSTLRAVPVDDRAWLMAALNDAMSGGAPVLPVGGTVDEDQLRDVQAAAMPDGTALVVRTSGSTGRAKAVALSAQALRASAAATNERLGGPGQWLVALPVDRIAGVQMLVRSDLAGTAPVFAAAPGDAEALLADSEALTAERRYLSVVPVQLARLLDVAAEDEAAADALRRFDAVLVGGQALPLHLRRRAHEAGVRIARSYGMTETAGGCVYDGVEIGDTRVRIRRGEVQVSGSALALGYVGDPGLTDERFITDTGIDGVARRWYRTGDAGELLGGMLTVTGRLDRVVISGGVNVSLDEVERVVREHRGWGSAVAVARDDAEWGQRVALVVETEDGAEQFAVVRDAVHRELGRAAAPDWATEADELPRLASGKPDLPAIESWLQRLRSSFRETAPQGSVSTSDSHATKGEPR